MNYVFLMFLLIKKKTIKRKRMSLIRIYENELPADDFRVPIPDEIFRKYLLEEHSIEHDGKTVAYGDIKDVTEIDCSAFYADAIDKSTLWDIQSLEGLEYFTAIEELWMYLES